jgi:peptide/nickel transport system ATP-binding protein
MGLLAPSVGTITYDGTRIDDLDEGARRPFRRKMQMIFQNPYASLNPRMTVRQTLSESLRYLGEGMSARAVDAKIEETMLSVGASVDWGSRMPHEFSGGQRQRISIASALITDPEFIVADEPISALDVSIQAQVLNLLTKAREERGLTYFFITHDLSVVEHFGDRVAVMYLGEVVELAPVATIFDAPQHPYTRLLLSAIPRIGGTAFQAERAPGEIPTAIDPPKGCAFASRCPLAHDRCRVENPTLKPTPAGTLAACHAID